MNQILKVTSIFNFEIRYKGKSNYKDYIPIQENSQISTVSPLETTRPQLQKGQPRADTKIQSLLLPKGSNSDTFREEKACCKKICMIRNIANPLLASVLLPDTFCIKNNAISPEATKTQRIASTDRKGFYYGFHHQPAKYKTARMDKPREARPAATKIASVFAARKYSSSTYQDQSTTLIRRSSTLQGGTPLGTHNYNCKIEEISASDPT